MSGRVPDGENSSRNILLGLLTVRPGAVTAPVAMTSDQTWAQKHSLALFTGIQACSWQLCYTRVWGRRPAAGSLRINRACRGHQAPPRTLGGEELHPVLQRISSLGERNRMRPPACRSVGRALTLGSPPANPSPLPQPIL